MEFMIMPFKRYFEVSGRSRRKEYWLFGLLITILSFIPILGLIVGLLTLIPSITVSIRRMHDVGKSGWFMLIPIYGIYLACLDSEHGVNQYGENPKEI